MSGAEDLVADLIRSRTPSGDAAGQGALMDACADYVHRNAPGTSRAGGRGEHPWTLLATGDVAGGGVLFVCHTDTVPEGDPTRWAIPPFEGRMTAEAFHGRGSVDMKGGLVAALEALVHAHHRGHAAAVLLTSDEEIGSRGATAVSASLPSLAPDLVIVPEATNNAVALGHRGATWISLSARGVAAHGSTPDRGVNAITLLSEQVISVLDGLPLDVDEYLGRDSVNLGTISGGSAPNIVPAEATLTLDVRTVHGGDRALQWARTRHRDIAVHTGLDLPAVHTPQVPAVLRDYPTAPPAAYFTDASALQPRFPGTPFVIWGPGDPAQMHAVDEHLPRAAFHAAVANYQAVLDAL